MHARLSRFAGLPPERIDQTVRGFEQGELPNLEQQEGFSGVIVMVNRGTGQAAAVSFWDTEANLKESERTAERAREAAVEAGQPDREPAVDRYEVLLHRMVQSGQ